MKTLTTLFTIIVVCASLMVGPVRAQQPQAASIEQLKEQIQRLESIDLDPATEPEVRALNRNILRERRTQLRALLQRRANSLRNYLAAMSFLSPAERQGVENAITNLENELQRLEGNPQADAPARATANGQAPAQLLASARPAASSLNAYSRVSVSSSVPMNDVLMATSQGTRSAQPSSSPTPQSPIKITLPASATVTVFNQGSINLTVEVRDSNVKSLQVQVRDSSGRILFFEKTVSVGANSRTETISVPLRAGENRITVLPLNARGGIVPVPDSTLVDTERTVTCEGPNCGTGAGTSAPTTTSTPIPDRFSSIYARGIVGFEQAGASAANSQQRLFMELFFNPPIILGDRTIRSDRQRARLALQRGITPRYERTEVRRIDEQTRQEAQRNSGSEGTRDRGRLVYPARDDPDFLISVTERQVYPALSLWGSVRLTSAPRQLATPLAAFSSSFFNPITQSNVNDLVQAFDFIAGVEKFIYAPGFFTGRVEEGMVPTGTPNTTQRYSAYLIAGAGAINPLSPTSSAEIFLVPNDAVLSRLLGPDTPLPTPRPTYVALVSPDRENFFRQYYIGLRIKSHFFQRENGDQPYTLVNRPGSMFDITWGQNELASGGRLRGSVLRFDGFYPLPILNTSSVYIYGTAVLNIRRPGINDPLILTPAPATVTIFSENVFPITRGGANRDYFRLGLGLNLIELVNSLRGNSGDRGNSGNR